MGKRGREEGSYHPPARADRKTVIDHTNGETQPHPNGVAQHSTAQHSTALPRAAQHSPEQHSTAQQGTAGHSTGQGTTHDKTAQHSTAGHNTGRQNRAGQQSTHLCRGPWCAHDDLCLVRSDGGAEAVPDLHIRGTQDHLLHPLAPHGVDRVVHNWVPGRVRDPLLVQLVHVYLPRAVVADVLINTTGLMQQWGPRSDESQSARKPCVLQHTLNEEWVPREHQPSSYMPCRHMSSTSKSVPVRLRYDHPDAHDCPTAHQLVRRDVGVRAVVGSGCPNHNRASINGDRGAEPRAEDVVDIDPGGVPEVAGSQHRALYPRVPHLPYTCVRSSGAQGSTHKTHSSENASERRVRASTARQQQRSTKVKAQ